MHPLRDTRDADDPGIVEDAVEGGAVLRPRVLVEHPVVEPAVHALARSARAERAAAAHQGVQHSHRGASLLVLPATLELKGEDDVGEGGVGTDAVVPAHVRRGRGRRAGARGKHRQQRLRGGDQLAVVAAARGEHHARGGVRRLDERGEGVAVEARERGWGRHEGRPEAAGERDGVRRLHDQMRGVLREARHLLLELSRHVRNLVVRELLVHHRVGEELDSLREVSAEAVHGVRHLFARRGRQQVRADHLSFASDSKRGSVGGGSPRHAFEEV
mmetsp:Transcript_10528/g.48353  ORF Transcript_10528/g.48353 Transcript_10528/m.48353 type:complete len:273 (+) Transcript_10528:915-1733(+)